MSAEDRRRVASSQGLPSDYFETFDADALRDRLLRAWVPFASRYGLSVAEQKISREHLHYFAMGALAVLDEIVLPGERPPNLEEALAALERDVTT
jgi:hypothetical protein